MKKATVLQGRKINKNLLKELLSKNIEIGTDFILLLYVSTDGINYEEKKWFAPNEKVSKEFLQALPYKNVILVAKFFFEPDTPIERYTKVLGVEYYEVPTDQVNLTVRLSNAIVEKVSKPYSRNIVTFKDQFNWECVRIEILDKDVLPEVTYHVENIKAEKTVTGKFLPILIGRRIYVEITTCINGFESTIYKVQMLK